MSNQIKAKIGILAFGSLINEPGEELKPLIVEKIECVTPFNVEFARISKKTRSNAPTLIPIQDNNGIPVKAMILVLDSKISVQDAETMLWRRETRNNDYTKVYKRPLKATPKSVLIEVVRNFHDVETVLYVSLSSNFSPITPKSLADYAIQSIKSKAGINKLDGIRYLLDAKRNGIITRLSVEYELEILNQTECKTLEEAIEQLDIERSQQRPKNFFLITRIDN